MHACAMSLSHNHSRAVSVRYGLSYARNQNIYDFHINICYQASEMEYIILLEHIYIILHMEGSENLNGSGVSCRARAGLACRSSVCSALAYEIAIHLFALPSQGTHTHRTERHHIYII